VVKDIEKLVGNLESYHAEGVMVLNTGQEPQEYGVVVSFQKPEYYRIALTNEANDVTQIVLRNDEGVFVLTPHLNKSFRFKSDWPNNQGQAYLYQTIAEAIVHDNERQFAAEEDAYVFDVMANYHNASLVRQKIWLSKEDYKPQRVVVTDADANEMVTVTFNHFEFNKTFETNWFDMQRNMTSVSIPSLPVLAGEGEAAHQQQAVESVGIIYPAYVPEGVEEGAPIEMKLGERDAVMIRYTGNYSYTLVQAKAAESRMASSAYGQVMDLGETVGVLIGEGDYQTLLWTSDGVDYQLTSANLPSREMVEIAKSTFGQTGK
jgi:outer membrane lipoprotein-sorting protein